MDIEIVRVQKVPLEAVTCSTKNECNSCVHVVQGTDVRRKQTLCTAIHLGTVWSVSMSTPFWDV
jgi:hypothetical protein